jgi:hypothetical protein
MAFDIGNILQQYLGGGIAAQNNSSIHDDFDQIAQSAPRAQVAQGVSEALRSDQTPPFPQMVGQMFGNSNPNQRAGMHNQLLASVGPGLLSAVAGGALGNIFGGANANARPQITPEQAAQVSPQQVEELAARAEQENPGVVDRLGDFYAEHPTLIKAVGGAALAIVLGRVAQGMRH